MAKKSTLVVAVLGFGLHLTIGILSEFNLALSEKASCILYVIAPVTTSLFILIYAWASKMPVVQILIWSVIFVTAFAIYIFISETTQGGYPENLTLWNLLQFWLVNLVLWTPASLGAMAVISYLVKKE